MVDPKGGVETQACKARVLRTGRVLTTVRDLADVNVSENNV